MDSKINVRRLAGSGTGPVLRRRLKDRSPNREKTFMLPRNGEEDDESSDEAGVDKKQGNDDVDLLSPQPRRERLTVSRTRLEDEAGQRIDLRG